jgi:hypothetical protein
MSTQYINRYISYIYLRGLKLEDFIFENYVNDDGNTQRLSYFLLQ